MGFEFPHFDERLIPEFEGLDELREDLREFGECLREHGATTPEGGEFDPGALRSALEECRSLLGDRFPGLADGELPPFPEFEGFDELRESLREFGECLRDQLGISQGEFDHETWRSAIEACRELLPDRDFSFEYHSTETAAWSASVAPSKSPSLLRVVPRFVQHLQ